MFTRSIKAQTGYVFVKLKSHLGCRAYRACCLSYWILYYSFLSPQKLKNVDEIIEVLRPHIRDISSSTYYRLRKSAVESLSSVLWGFSAKDTLDTLGAFFSTIP